MNRRQLILALAALGAGRAAFSQTTGAPLRIVVPAAAGTPADKVARLLAEKLKGIYAPEVSVANLAGAGGREGVEAAKSAVSDSTTVLLTPDFPITVYPHSVPKLGYDPLRDFVPIAMVVRSPVAVAIGPASPPEVKTVKDFVAWAKANPQRASYAAQGSAQLVASLLAREAGIKMSRRKTLQDASIVFASLSDLVPDLRAGNARAIAVTGSRRAGLLPEVVTMAESGYPNVSAAPWLGTFAPAGTPADAIRRLANGINDAASYGAVQREFFGLGMEPVAMTSVGFANAVRSDLERWAPLVKASGFSPEA